MRKFQTVPHFTSTSDFERYLPTTPILSSREAGWEGIMVRTYQEVPELEETLFPGGPDIYLILVTSGAVQVSERKIHGPWRTYPIHEGDWFLTPAAGEPYALRWKSLSTDPLTTIHLHLNADLFAQTVQRVTDHDPGQVAVQERTGLRDPLLAHLALSLRHELQQAFPGSLGKLYAETAAQMLATHLLRHYATTSVRIREYHQKLSSRQMQRVTAFIQDHLDQDLSLASLAQQIALSPYYFARLFRQTTGESVHQFVLRQRLTQASRLLKETDVPLAQVAAAVGIPNQSHFTQAFRRRWGVTPRMYRQES